MKLTVRQSMTTFSYTKTKERSAGHNNHNVCCVAFQTKWKPINKKLWKLEQKQIFILKIWVSNRLLLRWRWNQQITTGLRMGFTLGEVWTLNIVSGVFLTESWVYVDMQTLVWVSILFALTKIFCLVSNHLICYHPAKSGVDNFYLHRSCHH